MSLGAAVGGFAKGLAGGMKLSSELEDAKERRGLMALQREQTEFDLNAKKELQALNTQLFQESKDWQSGGGAYAPQEGMTYDAGSDEAARLHYSRIQPLLERQAALTGKNVMDVRKSIADLEKERYSQQLFRASQLIQAGDLGGIEMLKGPYNRLFKDGRSLESGSYDPETDTYTLSYKDKDGTLKSAPPVKRAELAERYALGALNAPDAVKLMTQVREGERDRGSREGIASADRTSRETIAGKDIESREGIATADRGVRVTEGALNRASEERRAGISAAATRYSADKGAEGRGNAGVEARYEKNYDDFRKELPNTFGYDAKNPFQKKGTLEKYNAQAATATEIWKATAKSNVNLSGPQVRQVMEAIAAGQEKVLSEKDGYRLVEVGSIRAVVPAPKQ